MPERLSYWLDSCHGNRGAWQLMFHLQINYSKLLMEENVCFFLFFCLPSPPEFVSGAFATLSHLFSELSFLTTAENASRQTSSFIRFRGFFPCSLKLNNQHDNKWCCKIKNMFYVYICLNNELNYLIRDFFYGFFWKAPLKLLRLVFRIHFLIKIP